MRFCKRYATDPAELVSSLTEIFYGAMEATRTKQSKFFCLDARDMEITVD